MGPDRSPVIDPSPPCEQIYRILVRGVCKLCVIGARWTPSVASERIAAVNRRSVMMPGVRMAFMLALASSVSVAAADPFDRGLLWRLDKPGTSPSWVYGTLHSSDPRVTALPPPVASALAAARTFAMEIYLTDVEAAAFFEASQFDDGRRLAPLLGEEAYARLRDVLGPSAPPEGVLARTKPWAALLMIDAVLAATDG